MSKLKKLVSKLSPEEFEIIFKNLQKTEANKSAQLLDFFRNENYSDKEIKDKLEVNNNAYYTLRSRLNDKIEAFFLEKIESPRTALLKKVANVNELIFNKNKVIAITTLQKLERELKEYDLSSELITVYKALKKMHFGTDKYYEYSQQYNRHVAFTLAFDKAEDLVADFFFKYADQLLHYDNRNTFSIEIILKELNNTSQLYNSHRLKVLHELCYLFHLIVTSEEKDVDPEIRSRLFALDDILLAYRQDSIYHNLRSVVKYLETLHHYFNSPRRDSVKSLFDELKPAHHLLLQNYSTYTCAFLIPIIRIYLLKSNKEFNDRKVKIEVTKQKKLIDKENLDIPTTYSTCIFYSYTSFVCEDYQDSLMQIEPILEKINSRNYLELFIDLKLYQAFILLRLGKKDDVEFSLNTVQRLLRQMGDERKEHSYHFMKLLRSKISTIEKKKKENKIETYSENFKEAKTPYLSPLKLIKDWV